MIYTANVVIKADPYLNTPPIPHKELKVQKTSRCCVNIFQHSHQNPTLKIVFELFFKFAFICHALMLIIFKMKFCDNFNRLKMK